MEKQLHYSPISSKPKIEDVRFIGAAIVLFIWMNVVKLVRVISVENIMHKTTTKVIMQVSIPRSAFCSNSKIATIQMLLPKVTPVFVENIVYKELDIKWCATKNNLYFSFLFHSSHLWSVF